jgi:predicted enzyme related to lactoylglutathione lyase
VLTTDFTHGAPVWVDLEAPVVDDAVAFYRAVLDWEFRDLGAEAMHYHICCAGGRAGAAIGPGPDAAAAGGWKLYFHTEDVDATTKAVEQAGGSVLVPPGDVGPMGRMAVLADPAGARFALWQPGTVPGLERVSEPGSLTWTELYTTDPAAVRRFYSTVFDWEFTDHEMPGLPGGGTYTVMSRAGKGSVEERTIGGIVPIVPEMASSGVTPLWQLYFAVADCDATVATARRHGAALVRPAMTVEGVGRWAHLTDPSGARFSVISEAPAG